MRLKQNDGVLKAMAIMMWSFGWDRPKQVTDFGQTSGQRERPDTPSEIILDHILYAS